MAGNRSLGASDGTFVLDNYWDDNAVARIDFRLTGGADGLGALLLEPRIKEIAGFDIDPATMKGKTDLRVGIGLPVENIPAFIDLPLKVERHGERFRRRQVLRQGSPGRRQSDDRL